MSGESNSSTPSTPASSPTTSAPSPAAAPNAGAPEQREIDWSTFTGLEDSPVQAPPPAGEKGGLAGPADPANGGAPQQPAAALATTDGNQPAAAPIPTAPVAVTPAQAPAQPGGEQTPAATFDPYNPEWQAGHVQALAGTFALSQEQAERLQTEPEKVLPELAGRLMLSTQLWVTQFVDDLMQQYIPSLVTGQFAQRESRASAQTAFKERVVSAFPKLAEMQAEQLLPFTQQIARAMPNAKPEERIAALGRAVYAMYGWPLPQSRSQSQPTQSATPAAPAALAPTPWMPMAAGAAPPQHVAPANGRDPNNPWEDLLT